MTPPQINSVAWVRRRELYQPSDRACPKPNIKTDYIFWPSSTKNIVHYIILFSFLWY
jgi:hypothetical protein